MKTARQWINTISDPIVKKYLRENSSRKACIRFTFEYCEGRGTWSNMYDFIQSFSWEKSKQGSQFWEAIADHFLSTNGKKSYKDFKHLDKSVKP